MSRKDDAKLPSLKEKIMEGVQTFRKKRKKEEVVVTSKNKKSKKK